MFGVSTLYDSDWGKIARENHTVVSRHIKLAHFSLTRRKQSNEDKRTLNLTEAKIVLENQFFDCITALRSLVTVILLLVR